MSNCCALPGESRSKLWSMSKTLWFALAFLTGFVTIFSSGSIFEDAVASTGVFMFSTVVTIALALIPLAHREWVFGRKVRPILILATWLIATVTFIRTFGSLMAPSFAPMAAIERASVGIPRGLLAVMTIGFGFMAWNAGRARWPEIPDDADAKEWTDNLRALLTRYYSWPASAADEACLAALDQAEEADMDPIDALGQPWEVAQEFATSNPDVKTLNTHLPMFAGIAFLILSVGSIAIQGVSAMGVLLGVFGLILIAFARWASAQG